MPIIIFARVVRHRYSSDSHKSTSTKTEIHDGHPHSSVDTLNADVGLWLLLLLCCFG